MAGTLTLPPPAIHVPTATEIMETMAAQAPARYRPWLEKERKVRPSGRRLGTRAYSFPAEPPPSPLFSQTIDLSGFRDIRGPVFSEPPVQDGSWLYTSRGWAQFDGVGQPRFGAPVSPEAAQANVRELKRVQQEVLGRAGRIFGKHLGYETFDDFVTTSRIDLDGGLRYEDLQAAYKQGLQPRVTLKSTPLGTSNPWYRYPFREFQVGEETFAPPQPMKRLEPEVMPAGRVRFELRAKGTCYLPARRSCAPTSVQGGCGSGMGPSLSVSWSADIEVSRLDEAGVVVRVEKVGPAAFHDSASNHYETCEQVASRAVARIVRLVGEDRAERVEVRLTPSGDRSAVAGWHSGRKPW